MSQMDIEFLGVVVLPDGTKNPAPPEALIDLCNPGMHQIIWAKARVNGIPFFWWALMEWGHVLTDGDERAVESEVDKWISGLMARGFNRDPKPGPIITEEADQSQAKHAKNRGSRPYLADQDTEYGAQAENVLQAYFVRLVGLAGVVHWPFGIYKVDFKITVGEHILFVDSEARPGRWADGDFPFQTVHVPYRKQKMIAENVPFFYYVLRRDMARALVIKGPDILASKVIEFKNQAGEIEKFFDVPAHQIESYKDLHGK